MTNENQFFIWEEKNLTDQKRNLSQNVGNVNCDTTTTIENDSTKNDLRDTTNTKISGIYKIVNKINGKYYVGSSENIKRRWKHHKNFLNKNIHDNNYLQNAWNKYGKNNFDFIIVEECDSDNRLSIEQKYIDICKNNRNISYNISCNAISPMIGNKHTEETKKKIKEKRKLQIITEETKKKQSEAISGKNHHFYGKKLSEKHKRKISLNHADVSGENGGNYNSTIYSFFNFKTNEIFNGTRYELKNKYNLWNFSMTNLISKKRSVKGWKLFTYCVSF